jgi:uncharacterized protein with GYD domain
MRTYLLEFSYTPVALRSLVANPQDRKATTTTAVESVGGKLTGFWYAFGDYDGYALAEFPDDTAAAAFAVAVSSSGALSKFVTVPLMEASEGMDAFTKAQSASYSPPTGA